MFNVVVYTFSIVLWFSKYYCFPLYQNDVSDILDLTFSMDADEEKQILYEKSEVCIGENCH